VAVPITPGGGDCASVAKSRQRVALLAEADIQGSEREVSMRLAVPLTGFGVEKCMFCS
jgi:hypothetical protein